MTFTVRSHDEIRATLLADQRARYQLRGYDLDVSRDSDAYAWADAFAFQVEGLEGLAAQLAKEIFPDTATTAFLERHAAVVGLSRKAATFATLTVNVAGTGLWTTANRLVSASGALFKPVAGGSVAGTPTTLEVIALASGTGGNLAAGTALTWSPAPSGITAATTVDEAGTVAVDLETDAALAQRILAWWRERPGGGNRADWKSWAEAVAGVEAAFVYPLLHPTLGAGTPGAVTLCVMQPMPTAESAAGEPLAANSRACAGSVLTAVETALFTTDGGKRPAVIDPDDVDVCTVTPQAQDVDVEVTLDGLTFPFAAPLAYTTGTTTQVTVASQPAGLIVGAGIAVPDSTIRGGYAYRKVTNITGAGPYVLTFAAVGTPSATGSILPLPTNAGAIRAAALAVFDALGPGAGTAPSARYPANAAAYYPQTLYRNSLVAALMGLPGVLGTAAVEGVEAVDVTLVGASNPELVVPTTETRLVTCGALRILEA